MDRITDFVRGTDELLFENAALTALGASGAMAAGDGRFRSVTGTTTTGQDSTDRLVYNLSTGSLYYDADGSGPPARCSSPPSLAIRALGDRHHGDLAGEDFLTITVIGQ